MRDWAFIQALGRFAPSRKRRRMLLRGARKQSSSVARYVTAGASESSLKAVASWLRKFLAFLCDLSWVKGKLGPSPKQFADNDNALRFLARVADEGKGRTRVAAASRAVDFARRLLGITPLAEDPRTALLKRGVLRSFPHKPRGAVPLPAFMMIAVVGAWSKSKVWWKRAVALAILVSFLALLRLAGTLAIPAAGVTWVMGRKERLNPKRIPRKVSGVLLLVPVRKTRQAQPSWIPIRSKRVHALLRRHIMWHRRRAKRNTFLFPSRKPKFVRGKRVWVPNPRNRMSGASFLRLMRRAIVQICGLSRTQASMFTLHSLRVGGINYLRQLGVHIGLRAKVASHKSIVTARMYDRLLPIERLYELSTLVES